ncbi:hypothetical protein Zmor_026375 [Zophobas morio]|uniref:Uncharacterized protein n=1 Tax=Zophobas morio TaxID=2755281 RepID=A0AA38HTQ7_9CUCU|nr:hypothetical protein Zmor_026375 [Zophobas morio]
MADTKGDAKRVVCFVGNVPAFRKRIYCGDWKVWSHRSCVEKKKSCGSSISEILIYTEDPNAMKNLVVTISSLTTTVADMKKCVTELISEKNYARKLKT